MEVEEQMITGIQFVGVIFALIMIYLTFLYYKKQSYSTKSFSLWMSVWIAFLIATFFPTTLYGLMQELSIQRTVDFFIIGGFMFFAVVIFYLFVTIKQLEEKIERIIREEAKRRAK